MGGVGKPRAFGGGRSSRYAERRSGRGTVATFAPAWSDGAARVVHAGLYAASEDAGETVHVHALWMFGETSRVAQFITGYCGELGASDRRLAATILEVHRTRVVAASGRDAAISKVRNFVKPLRLRSVARAEVGDLVVPCRSGGPASFHAWLSAHPEKERLRPISRCKRIVDGISRWPLSWLAGQGVVCYERAAARIRDERSGEPDGPFMRGVVSQVSLKTALACASDHYIVVSGVAPPRFMTVEEVARAFGVPAASPLMRPLAGEHVLTSIQAVACLGRGVHVGVAQQIVLKLVGHTVSFGGQYVHFSINEPSWLFFGRIYHYMH